MLPIARPAIAACLMIAFFEAWNEFAFAVTFVQDQDLWVTSVGLASWIGWLTVSTDVMMAGAIVFSTAVPALLPVPAALPGQRPRGGSRARLSSRVIELPAACGAWGILSNEDRRV